MTKVQVWQGFIWAIRIRTYPGKTLHVALGGLGWAITHDVTSAIGWGLISQRPSASSSMRPVLKVAYYGTLVGEPHFQCNSDTPAPVIAQSILSPLLLNTKTTLTDSDTPDIITHPTSSNCCRQRTTGYLAAHYLLLPGMETARISPALIQGGIGGARTHAAHVAAAPVAPASRVRRKRAQVARACDGCRLQRIKCDNQFPCANCDARGRECSNSESARTSTLSQAHDEIVQLKKRVKDLEAELISARAGPEVITTTTPTPTATTRTTTLSPSQLPTAHLTSKNKIQSWAGVKLCPARAPNESWFGPSSLYFFLQRMNTSLITVLTQSLKPDRLFLASTTTKRLLDGPGAGSDPHGGDAIGSALNPTQEQYFIDLYWHSYHTTLLPVIDEAEFKEHHQSLWAAGATRKPSALVDIILALCMRLDFEAAPVDSTADVAAVPGRWHYRRCQALLAQELESPSISTLQCQMLSAIYLCGGSFHNMVDSAASALVRTAYILGLHVEPPAGTPRAEVEKRRRLWWTAYLLESMICMKLGRPFQSRDTHVMPSLPADDIEAAALSGSRFAPIGKEIGRASCRERVL